VSLLYSELNLPTETKEFIEEEIPESQPLRVIKHKNGENI